MEKLKKTISYLEVEISSLPFSFSHKKKQGRKVPVKVSIPEKNNFRITCYLSSDVTVDIQLEWH